MSDYIKVKDNLPAPEGFFRIEERDGTISFIKESDITLFESSGRNTIVLFASNKGLVYKCYLKEFLKAILDYKNANS